MQEQLRESKSFEIRPEAPRWARVLEIIQKQRTSQGVEEAFASDKFWVNTAEEINQKYTASPRNRIKIGQSIGGERVVLDLSVPKRPKRIMLSKWDRSAKHSLLSDGTLRTKKNPMEALARALRAKMTQEITLEDYIRLNRDATYEIDPTLAM